MCMFERLQVTSVVCNVIIYAIIGELYTERASMLSTVIFFYAITSPINGYAGGGLYARMGGRLWIKQMLLSTFMIPALVCGTAFFINFIAMYYHASRAIPFGSMVSSYKIMPNLSYGFNKLVNICTLRGHCSDNQIQLIQTKSCLFNDCNIFMI
jgi:hypothetical protein